MPRQFLPKKSGPHRIACIALYRALLQQCSRLQLPPRFYGPVNPIKAQIRKQFNRNRHEVGAVLVVKALKIGYEAEELLCDAANGDETSYSKILNLLDEIKSTRNVSHARLAIRPSNLRLPHRKPEPYPDAPRILDSRPRPLSQLSGRRHLPLLINGNGFPFLRFKKPQSPFLSRVLRDKIAQRQRILDRMGETQLRAEWAEDEQQWEEIVNQTPEAIQDKNRNRDREERKNSKVAEYTWDRDIKLLRRGLQDDMDNWEAKAGAMSLEMLKVLDEEKKLFDEENALLLKERMAKERERVQKREGKRDGKRERQRGYAQTAADAASDPKSDPGSASAAGISFDEEGGEIGHDGPKP